jgi:hypothetical protein
MRNGERVSSRGGNEWDKERAGKAAVKLAEAHQELQAAYSRLPVQGNVKNAPVPMQQPATEKGEHTRRNDGSPSSDSVVFSIGPMCGCPRAPSNKPLARQPGTHEVG